MAYLGNLLVANKQNLIFEKAEQQLLNFLKDKKVTDVKIVLSKLSPQANKTSGKFNHIYKDF
mgnify:CR=1 FL=1